MPEIFTKDNADLKGIMISLIIQLEGAEHNVSQKEDNAIELEENGEASSTQYAELASMSIAELQVRLQKAWSEAGTLLSITSKMYLSRILKTTKELSISSAFGMPEAQWLLKVIAEKIEHLADFQDYGDFAKVNLIAGEAEKIADLFRKIMKNPYVLEHEQEFVTLFTGVDFSKFDYETLFSVLSLLTAIPQSNYLSLLHTIFADPRFIGKKERVVVLLNLLTALNNSYFPSEYLDAFSKLVITNQDAKDFNLIMAKMVTVFDKDNKDPVLELLMTHSELTYKQITQILNLSEKVEKNRDKLSTFLLHLSQTKKLDSLLKELANFEKENQQKIVEILSKGHALNLVNKTQKKEVDYKELTTLLRTLSVEELDLLHAFCDTTPVSADCLLNALKKSDRTNEFKAFLLEFAKAPFGERDLKQQFSRAEVERVINQSKDLLNDSRYTYQHRKQLMEAF
ncbi:MAG: hypothetical protein ACRCXC_02190 [Legionella sp.]